MKFQFFSLLMLAMLAFSSCQKGDFLKKDDYIKDEVKDGDKVDCFKLVYPVTYTMPDDSEVTVNNEEEFWTAIKAWYQAHPDSKAKPVLQYPVEIVFGDEIKTINNVEEMELAKKYCDEEDGDKVDCFKLVYPVTYTMPDGSEVTGNNEEEVWTAIKAWYTAHPDSKADAVLQYPVQIVFGDEIKTINNNEEMALAKKACKDDKGDMEICDWDLSKVSDPAVWTQYIVEPVVTNDQCGCPVSGVLKYVKTGTDFAYVLYYGKGECDQWGYLVTYYDGTDKKVKKCKVKFDCNPG